MERFYVDSNVWLDLAFDRRNHIRPLGELAFQFFKKCMRNEWKILYSDIVLEELGKFLTKEEIKVRCFGVVSEADLLVNVESTLSQTKEAKKVAEKHGVPAPDALHAILARDNKARLVSRDAHFEKLFEIVSVHLPEEI